MIIVPTAISTLAVHTQQPAWTWARWVRRSYGIIEDVRWSAAARDGRRVIGSECSEINLDWRGRSMIVLV
jgi:hypothetical protein